MSRLWRPDRTPPDGAGRLRTLWFYAWECKDRDLMDWPWRRPLGFALMSLGACIVSLGIRELW